jgi:hypothetical protein
MKYVPRSIGHSTPLTPAGIAGIVIAAVVMLVVAVLATIAYCGYRHAVSYRRLVYGDGGLFI